MTWRTCHSVELCHNDQHANSPFDLGIPSPTENIIAQQLVLNYVPIAFSTFFEPLWILLDRTLCVLQPFAVLFRENLPSATSIGLKYVSLPPQLVVWRALRVRHFLLASVSATAFLSNVLAVALASLFQVRTNELGQPAHFQFSSTSQSKDNSTIFGFSAPLDPVLYTLKTNLTASTLFPPWTSDDFFFLPVSLNEPSASSFEINTTGFGISSDCQVLRNEGPTSKATYSLSRNGRVLNFSSAYDIGDGDGDVTCVCLGGTHQSRPGVLQSTRLDIGRAGAPTTSGPHALAFSSVMESYQDSSNRSVSYCHGLLLYVWAHATFIAISSRNATEYEQSDADVLITSCRPTLKTANFLVRTDVNGRVISYSQESPFDPSTAMYLSDIKPSLFYAELAPYLSIWDRDSIAWHNETYAPDWTNYFLQVLTGSDSLVDPHVPLPNPTTFIPDLESLHRRLFSMLLSYDPSVLATPAPDALATGRVFSLQQRVFMNHTSFLVSVIILTLNLIVAILYYLDRPARFLPRMPISIASVFTYVAASHARRELRRGGRSETYRFGRHIGIDGKMHVGIEEAERVFPLPASYRKVGRRKPPPVPPKD